MTQQQPTTDRYKEIQQALAEKGYFSGTLDGNWGPDSTDALKRFQREQNLDPDGKIGALSLMALGLGPRRGTASAQSVKAPEGMTGAIPGSTIPAVAIPADPPPVAQPEP
jgi:peptidoglycan hydrolase-like protein with peptidoglycan-binding domain